jgi:hypothetical protein
MPLFRALRLRTWPPAISVKTTLRFSHRSETSVCGTLCSKHAVNMTFCGPARDTVLSNRQTGKLNFDTCYIMSVDFQFSSANQRFAMLLAK